MVTRRPPSPAEQELWNAVVTGVRAADNADETGVAAAVGRLARLPQPWACRVLEDTSALLAEEHDPSGRALRTAAVGHLPLPRGTGTPAGRAGGERTPAIGTPEWLRHRLLLIHRLAGLGEEGVGAVLDVALAGNRRRPPAELRH